MLLKLLDALEKNVTEHGCAINDVLYDYDKTLSFECFGECSECDECKEYSLEQIKKLKQSLENKQAISDKTSYIEEQMRELSRKPLHDAETIARALEKVNDQSDKVNHPTHYNVHKHECIDEMVAVFGVEAVKHFCKCNAWKYRYRSVAKNGEEDLKKADWYLEKLMELEKGETK